MKFSKMFNLSIGDAGRGFIVTLIGAALTVLYSSISEGALPTGAQLKTALLVGLGAGISYLLKNVFTGVPAVIEVDPAKTIVVNEETKQVLVEKQPEFTTNKK